jgi:hypothetical protein
LTNKKKEKKMKEKVRHTIEEKKKERAGLFPSSRTNKKRRLSTALYTQSKNWRVVTGEKKNGKTTTTTRRTSYSHKVK